MTIVDQNPTNVAGSLGELLTAGDTSAKPVTVLTGYNLGNNTLLVTLPMTEFIQRSEVANERGILASKGFEGQRIAQRKLDPSHAAKLATYILKGLVAVAIADKERRTQAVSNELREIQRHLGEQPYLALQPVVANIRSCSRGGANLRAERVGEMLRVYLSDRDIFWIVDGQHRRYAMNLIEGFLIEIKDTHRYPKRPKLYAGAHRNELTAAELQAWLDVFATLRMGTSVAVEVHLGLGADEERQLFHDLNNLGKKVEAGLAFEFDNSNPVNVYIKDELTQEEFWRPGVADSDIVDWHDDEGRISRKDLIAINAILFLNKTNVKGAQPLEVESKKAVASRVWQTINNIDGFGEPGAKMTTVAAQPVVLKAIAKLAYDFAFGKHPNSEHLDRLLAGVERIDFSHANPMWRYYELPPVERKRKGIDGLEEFLPSEAEGANRDIGKYDPTNDVMRFGAKHNDIFPIIGDMIRWRLGLPNRNAEKGAMAGA